MTIVYNKQVLLKRGNTAQNNNYLGPLGEVTIDTDLMQLRVHDGSTVGGHPVTSGQGNVNLESVTGNIIPSSNVTYSLGNSTHQWKDLWVSGNTIYINNTPVTVDTGGNLLVGGSPITANTVVTPSLILTNDPIIFNPYAGEIVTFTKEDYATGAEARDEIDANLAIARANNQGIYNPYLEPQWDDNNNDGPSPAGTVWNKDGWGDLTNVADRIYYSFYDINLGQIGNNVRNTEFVMKDVANNKYYKFMFTVWGNNNNGAPVTYTRTQINSVTGEEIGEPVTFEKTGYADPTVVNDPIDTGLTIARGNNQSIYNIALENSYNSQGDGEDSPEGTEWNSDGWGALRDVKQRHYGTFLQELNYAIGENILGRELIMHDTINDKYYAVKFSSWTQGGNGGGFSYTRQLLNTTNLFVKPDNDTETRDIFLEDNGLGSGIAITRDEYNGIYNPYREEGWNSDESPLGTLWNIEGWDDFSNITERRYVPFYAAFGYGGLGYKVPGTKSVMYIPETEQYFAIHWLTWTQGGGGGFSYIRYELDPTKLSEGIRFADDTVLKSAEGLGKVKSRASGGRRIEEAVGNKTVSVTAQTPTVYTLTFYENRESNQIWATRNPESEAIMLPLYNGEVQYTRFEISVDGGNTYADGMFTGYNGSFFFLQYNDGRSVSQISGESFDIRVTIGGDPQIWWDKNDLPSGGNDFRGAVIDYHAYTGEATFIGTIHIVQDTGSDHITHTEVSSGDNDSINDDLWYVDNEGTISYRRLDGEAKTLKIHWSARVFYGVDFWD